MFFVISIFSNTDTDADTDVGITNTEKYQIPIKNTENRAYRPIGISDFS